MQNRFVNLVKTGRGSVMTYIASFFVVVMFFIAGQAVTLLILGQAGITYTPEVARRMGYETFMAILMIQFFTGLAGLFLSIRFLHQRRPITLMAPEGRFRWGNFLFGMGVTALILLISDLISYQLDPKSFQWQFDPSRFYPLLLVALLVFPVQTAFEEFTFRGYLLPSAGYHSRSVWVGLVVSSLLFGLLHMANTEVGRYGWVEMLAVYVGMGLVFGLVTLVSEGVEMSWGIHLVNNLYVVLVKTFPGSSLESPALFRTTAPDTGVIVRETLVFCVLILAITWIRYRKTPLQKVLG